MNARAEMPEPDFELIIGMLASPHMHSRSRFDEQGERLRSWLAAEPQQAEPVVADFATTPSDTVSSGIDPLPTAPYPEPQQAAPKQAMGAAQPAAPEGGDAPAAGAVVVDEAMVERAIRAYDAAYFASSKDAHQSFRAALTAAIGGA